MGDVVAGVFRSRAAAEEAVDALRAAGVPDHRLSLLAPGEVPAESPPGRAYQSSGAGAAVGGVVGASALIAAGVPGMLGTVLVPGVGPVVAVGVGAVALLGACGAAVGAALGDAAESALRSGGWGDHAFAFENCLRQGQSVVIVEVSDVAEAGRARAALDAAGARSLEELHEAWWRQRAAACGETDPRFRRGYEAALRPEARGRSWEEARPFLAARYEDYEQAVFRRGFEAGAAHRRELDAADAAARP